MWSVCYDSLSKVGGAGSDPFFQHFLCAAYRFRKINCTVSNIVIFSVETLYREEKISKNNHLSIASCIVLALCI